MRSLVKASSLSFDASTLANSGIRCKRSTSSRRLTRLTSFYPTGPPASRLRSFGLHQRGERRPRPVELGEAAVLDDVAVLHHQDAVEMARLARAMQDADEAALAARRLDAVHNLGLGGAVERRRRLVEDGDVRPLEQRARQRRLLLLRHREARAAAADAEFWPEGDAR